MPTTQTKPFANSAATKFIDKHMEKMSGRGKTQREISAEAGFKVPNFMSMIRNGDSKMPIDRVPALAKALDVDEVQLFKLVIDQHFHSPEMNKMIARIEGQAGLTKNEQKWIELIRSILAGADDAPSSAMKDAVREALASWFSKSKADA